VSSVWRVTGAAFGAQILAARHSQLTTIYPPPPQ
jgi:hypothetical protein